MEIEVRQRQYGCLSIAFWMLLIFFSGMVLIGLGSCKSVQYVPVETIQHDSIYLSKVQHDSIYLQEYINVYQKADTVYKEKIVTKYKEKLLRDTIYINKVDSVYQKKIVEVEKQLTSSQQSLMNMGRAFVLLLILGLAYLAYKVYRKIKVS